MPITPATLVPTTPAILLPIPPAIQKSEARGSEVQEQVEPHNKLKASLGNLVRTCLQKRNNKIVQVM